MARKKKGQQPENLGDFAGPNADQQQIEQLANQAAAANAKAGHNSGEPQDEVLKRNFTAIETAHAEVLAAQKLVQTARAAMKVARNTAKTDLGSKAWVESLVAAVKLKKEAEKGGAGEIVTEHRQMGRILRLMDVPLGTQFKLFAFDDGPATTGEAKSTAMDAELQGQHAWRNNEPESNNPFTAGTEEHVDWQRGHRNAMAAAARSMGNGAEAQH